MRYKRRKHTKDDKVQKNAGRKENGQSVTGALPAFLFLSLLNRAERIDHRRAEAFPLQGRHARDR